MLNPAVSVAQGKKAAKKYDEARQVASGLIDNLIGGGPRPTPVATVGGGAARAGAAGAGAATANQRVEEEAREQADRRRAAQEGAVRGPHDASARKAEAATVVADILQGAGAPPSGGAAAKPAHERKQEAQNFASGLLAGIVKAK